MIDADKLMCALDPEYVPSIMLDTELPLLSLEDAWHDCWVKLKYIRDLVASWRQGQSK